MLQPWETSVLTLTPSHQIAALPDSVCLLLSSHSPPSQGPPLSPGQQQQQHGGLALPTPQPHVILRGPPPCITHPLHAYLTSGSPATLVAPLPLTGSTLFLERAHPPLLCLTNSDFRFSQQVSKVVIITPAPQQRPVKDAE